MWLSGLILKKKSSSSFTVSAQPNEIYVWVTVMTLCKSGRHLLISWFKKKNDLCGCSRVIVTRYVILFFPCFASTNSEQDRGWSALAAGSWLTSLVFRKWSSRAGRHFGTVTCDSTGRTRPPVTIGFTGDPKPGSVKTAPRYHLKSPLQESRLDIGECISTLIAFIFKLRI